MLKDRIARKLRMVVLIGLSFTEVLGQASLEGNRSSSLPNFTKSPPSPEVANLGKYGDIPVGLRTGTMSYSIPIYTIQLKELSVPISIDYHSSGIKVNELASSVGLGWALNAGGVVTSSINGYDDLTHNGWRTGQFMFPQNLGIPFKTDGWDPYLVSDNWMTDPHYDMLLKATTGEFDSEPDLFFYNFIGQSGKFVLDTAGNVLPIPFNKKKIQISQNGCIIIDESGNVFEFNAVENTTTMSQQFGGNPSLAPGSTGYSFHLSKISTPYGEVVNFVYDMIMYGYESGRTHTRFYFPPMQFLCGQNRPEPYFSVSTTGIIQPRLKEINSNKGHKVTFTYSNSRQDLPGIHALSNIKVFKGANPFIVNYNLYHSYFGDISSQDKDAKRLKLDSLKADFQPAYRFSYMNPSSVPHRLSSFQDHWGYFNNSSNLDLLPADPINGFPNGANREVDPNSTKNGILNQITYPTGGYTQIEYEVNQAWSTSENANVNIGGLRVKKTTDVSWDGQPVVADYEYLREDDPTRSSGLSLFQPVYTYPHYWEYLLPEVNYYHECQCTAQTSFPISQIGLGNAGSISYYTVTVKKGGNNLTGKTVHTFGGNASYSAFHGYPFGPTISNDWAANDPTEIKDYQYTAGQWILTNKKEFIYKDHFARDPQSQSLPNERFVRGVKISLFKFGVVPPVNVGDPEPPRSPIFHANPFFYFSSWYYLKETRETIYTNGQQPFTTVKKIYHDNPSHAIATREVVSNSSTSQADSTIVVKKFPMDYSSGVSTAINKMVELNILAKPIEIQEIKKIGSTSFLVGGIISVPTLFSNVPIQNKFYQPELTDPTNITAYNYPKSAGKFTTLFPSGTNPFVLKLEAKTFDAFGNVLEVEKNGGLSRDALLWDYDKAFMVGKVSGATSAQVSITSFETSEKGGWTYAGTPTTANPKTGYKCYNLSLGNITKSGIGASTSNKYKLSFWARRATGSGNWNFLGISEPLGTDWKLIEREVTTGSLTISGSEIIVDELRLHPIGSLVETYTYNPHLGITSVSDTRNQVTIYVYDQFGRLKGSKNTDQQFLDYYEYKYFKGN